MSENTQEGDLQELFKPFGHIARIYLAKDKITGQCKVNILTSVLKFEKIIFFKLLILKYTNIIYNFVIQGFAFINYHKKDDAAKAIATLNGFGYDHLILNVEWAKPSGS